MCENKIKSICITVGKNMTKVIKYLNKIQDWISFNRLFTDINKPNENVSMKYPIGLFNVLIKLENLELIDYKSEYYLNEIDFHYNNYLSKVELFSYIYYKISERGKLLLQILRKDP